ncbi:MAG: serine hydrolase [Chthoniobacter sp.]|uniref:serine hydrolase domain-containing protein n=1 Tax=Chthoniobacter sp. TaxID=2510640 RepID=UPI0032A845C4
MFPTRRTFLKQLGFGAGALALGAALERRAFAATRGLPRSTPEAEGVSSPAIEAFLDALAQSKHEFHSIVVARHGRVIAEGWWAPYAAELPHTMYSMSKSFTSTAVGLAVAEGKLSVEDKVTSFFPDDLPKVISDNLAALQVKHLLTMSVGNEHEPTYAMVEQQNWVRAFLAAPITHTPGSVFLYNSAATYMCSAIVQRVTGQKVIDYLTPKLFTPLNIEGMTWETCPRGINTGGWGLSIQTEGLAKFGQLYLQKGKWGSKEILPPAWVEEATTKHIQQPDPAKPSRPHEDNDWVQGYGYQFWRCRHNAFRGDGAFGQFTIVLPEQDAVIAITGESADLQGELDLVWQHLLPAMQEKPLPADAAAQTRLRERLAGLALPPPAGPLTSPVATNISGKMFRLNTNSLGLQNISFDFEMTSVHCTFRTEQDTYAISSGLGAWEHGETALPGTPPRIISGGAPPAGTRHKVAAAGTWKDDQTWVMTWRYYETPHHDTVSCHFDGDKVTVTFQASTNRGKDKRPVLQGQIVS